MLHRSNWGRLASRIQARRADRFIDTAVMVSSRLSVLLLVWNFRRGVGRRDMDVGVTMIVIRNH